MSNQGDLALAGMTEVVGGHSPAMNTLADGLAVSPSL